MSKIHLKSPTYAVQIAISFEEFHIHCTTKIICHNLITTCSINVAVVDFADDMTSATTAARSWLLCLVVTEFVGTAVAFHNKTKWFEWSDAHNHRVPRAIYGVDNRQEDFSSSWDGIAAAVVMHTTTSRVSALSDGRVVRNTRRLLLLPDAH